MMGYQVSRRQMLLGGAAMSLPLFGSIASAEADENVASPQYLEVGVSTLGFPSYTNAELAEALSRHGFRTIQLFLNQKDSRYWRYNGRSDVSEMTPARCEEIAQTYRSRGIEIHSLGVYTNLVHPDAAERAANLDYFEAMMKIARHMGVSMLITEAGHYHSDQQAPRVPHHFQEQVWYTTVETTKDLATRAKDHEVVVLFEPFFRGFLASAKRTRVFLEEVDSPHARALLDPANLLEVNDLDEMFAQLAPWIDCLHAKDRKLHVDRGVAAGQGDLDYPTFVKLAAKCTPKAPLILEYVGPEDYLQARKHLRSAM
jgi:sugar phosphate isomerase/epimerase